MKLTRLFTIQALLYFVLAGNLLGQTTEFTYQGRVLDNSVPSTAVFDFEFKLFDSLSGGTQLGTTQQLLGVQVTDGIFAVRLNFGSEFPGAARFLEIGLKNTAGQFTVLAPRQPLASTPYAIRSSNSANADTAANATTANNALSLGGVASTNYLQTNGNGSGLTNLNAGSISAGTLSNARLGVVPIANGGTGSGTQNFVDLTTAQTIGGNKIFSATVDASAVNSSTQFNIGGNRVLSIPGTANLFVGVGAGQTNGAAGINNAFFGTNAGQLNLSGDSNAFFGANAGQANTTGFNAFFGADAGKVNISGTSNSFFGASAGTSNLLGSLNAFFGTNAGGSNTEGDNNAFFGQNAGDSNSEGSSNTFVGGNAGAGNSLGNTNSFFGRNAGIANTIGSNNTTIGSLSNVGSNDLSYATAIGAASVASQSNSVFLGRPGGEDAVRIPGAIVLSGNLVMSSGSIASFSSPIVLTASGLGTSGGTNLCRNGTSQIALCSSSLRYKTNISRFSTGLEIVKRLSPISFDWKDGQSRDLGLGAEDVAAIEPLLVIYNEKSEVEGIKYDRIGVVLVNAVKEQQAQIESQEKIIAEQKESVTKLSEQVEALRKIVCSQNPTIEACLLQK